jgi:DNA invertase Pin-like site-specific DNA recombinase
MTMKCAIYSRVSTTDQHTENQVNKLRDIAKLKEYSVVKEFTDKGISGKHGRNIRTGFDTLIKGAVSKEFDMILVWSVDRLGRSLQDLISFLNEINSVGCNLYIHNSQLDSSTPSGKMLFSLLGVFSEFERSMISSRVKLGLQRAVSEGKKLGRPSKLNDGLIHSIKYMKEQGVGIRKMSRDLGVGVSTIYRVLETNEVPSRTTGTPN